MVDQNRGQVRQVFAGSDVSASTGLAGVVSRLGAAGKAKLSNPAASEAPEDQLRSPLETLIVDMAGMVGLPPGMVVPVGESSPVDLKTRPDYAVTVKRTLVGFIELEAPGKGADPRRFQDRHDQGQWEPPPPPSRTRSASSSSSSRARLRSGESCCVRGARQ